MARSHSIPIRQTQKPNPPLFAHNNGQWAKKSGQEHHFGVWADPEAAVVLYSARSGEAWEAGRNPRQAVARRRPTASRSARWWR